MKKAFIILKFSIVLLCLLTSCKKNDDDSLGQFEGGIYISNEGTFGLDDGSVTYYNTDLDTIYNSVFLNRNQRSPGDIVHSVAIYNRMAYICAQNSGKIEIADLKSFASLGTINNVDEVRYFIGCGNGNGYATSWTGVGQIKVINLSNNSVISSILLNRKGPDRMILNNDKVYVANSGGEGVDSTISVISTGTNEVIKTIYLDSYNPTGIVKDSTGNLWVLCKGKEYKQVGGPTPSKLIKINLQTDEIKSSVELFADQHPMHLSISSDGQFLYYGGGYDFNGIYKINAASLTVPTSPLINRKCYSIGINYKNGDVFALESPSYTSLGKLYIYKSDGTFRKTFEVGKVPGNVIY